MSRRSRRWRLGAAGLALVGSALLLGACSNDNGQNSLNPQGPNAEKIDNLMLPIFGVAIVIGILVLGGTIYAAIRFRSRGDGNENPKQIHGSTPLEIGWTILPALILAVIAVPTVRTIFDLTEEPEGDVLEVTVTGKQWWWEFEYPEEGIITANELHIPVDRPVHLTLESDNVIHSFWVPELAGKKDVMPGRSNELTIEADEPGLYLGQCAEYCGLSHADMRFRVFAQAEDDFGDWVAGQQQVLTGEKAAFVTQEDGPIAKAGCVACHAFNGVENAGARIGPNLTHLASRTTFASGVFDLNEENLRRWVACAPHEKPMQIASDGTAQVGMPCFQDDKGIPTQTNLTDDEVDQIVEYLLTLD